MRSHFRGYFSKEARIKRLRKKVDRLQEECDEKYGVLTVSEGNIPESEVFRKPRRFPDITSFVRFVRKLQESEAGYSGQAIVNIGQNQDITKDDPNMEQLSDLIRNLNRADRSRVEITVKPWTTANSPHLAWPETTYLFTNSNGSVPASRIYFHPIANGPNSMLIDLITNETVELTPDEIKAHYPVIPIESDEKPVHEESFREQTASWLKTQLFPTVATRVLTSALLGTVVLLAYEIFHVKLNL